MPMREPEGKNFWTRQSWREGFTAFENLGGMAGTASLGDLEAGIGASADEPHRRETVKAGPVLQAVRTADGAGKNETVERGAAAGLKIGLIPHGRESGAARKPGQAAGTRGLDALIRRTPPCDSR
jgi:hypothetical protein